ncbi:hypothetical protein ERO13_A03G148850v2 [Gossypium hirsutum]|uniref:Uncharacterized protein n=1 Tax=Gossypium mustelinum TaxID=34275 RepID=A0A5D2ZWU5_GOSMU|nr:hypothetical protein ERO13_A03G148850v2 [Gossypium hirsutum]TYJ43607.1 hypothetical protein E1A91_A03G164700v1 [Gossypium mustelinum]
MALKTMYLSVKKRIALCDGIEEAKSRRLYTFIKLFLFFSIFALVLEIFAYLKKWNLNIIQLCEVLGHFQLSWHIKGSNVILYSTIK